MAIKGAKTTKSAKTARLSDTKPSVRDMVTRDQMNELIEGANRLGITQMDFNDMISYFNLARLPDYENGAEPYIGYILMSRPSLNVVLDAGKSSVPNIQRAQNNYASMRRNSMTSALICDKYGQQMLQSLSIERTNPWLPFITTKAKSYSVNDMELKTVDKGNTYFGHMIKYGKHSEDHKVAGTISIDFRNDRFLSILKMMHIWMSYIYLVSKTGDIVPSDSSQKNGILDYAGSLYYLVTRRDGKELVYWEKLIGIFPIKLPLSIFSYSDTMILEDTVGIDFSYGIRADPMDPSILMDINVLSGHTSSSIQSYTTQTDYRPLPDEVSLQEAAAMDAQPDPKFVTMNCGNRTLWVRNHSGSQFISGDVLATNPFIRMYKQNNVIKYYLDWEMR